METKKLLKFLLKDLSELEELITEKRGASFDEFETEFMQTRVSGAKRMIQILYDRENSDQVENYSKPEKFFQPKEKIEVSERVVLKVEERKKRVEQKAEEVVVADEKPEEKEEMISHDAEVKIESENLEESVERQVSMPSIDNKEEISVEEKEEQIVREEKEKQVVEEKQVELADEVEEKDYANKRLGDSFLKGKSVNDLVNVDKNKLEHKISNRPVISIKSTIGINDRFQYIRELFNGHADAFTEAVEQLDKKNNIHEAVAYLQQNFKWKKNETSLKFVNLVKRRFSHE